MKRLEVVMLMFVLNMIIPALKAAAETGWKTYTSEFVGYSIAYPDFLKEIPWTVLHPEADPVSPAQWRNKTFRSSDGEVTLLVETQYTESTLSDLFEYAQHSGAEHGDNMEYLVTTNNWYVISGINPHGYEFYIKCYLFPPTPGENSDWYIQFVFVYPHSQHKIYDPLVGKITQSFVPKLPVELNH